VVTGTPHAIEHGTSRPGRWLRARRTRIALTIAAVEALLVAIFHDVSQWTVVGLALIAFLVYWAIGRNAGSDTFRQVSWILAVSQLGAVLAVIVAVIVLWTAIIAAVVFAAIALFLIFTDRR
jgi:hypothetical protein